MADIRKLPRRDGTPTYTLRYLDQNARYRNKTFLTAAAALKFLLRFASESEGAVSDRPEAPSSASADHNVDFATMPAILDVKKAHQFLNMIGFTYSLQDVERIAEERSLPFWLGPDGEKFFIRRIDLERCAIQHDDARASAATPRILPQRQSGIESDRMLDLKAAHQWFKDHGFNYSLAQVQRLAIKRKLPFRKGPEGRKLFIRMSDLKKLFDDN